MEHFSSENLVLGSCSETIRKSIKFNRFGQIFLATSTQEHLQSILAPKIWFWENVPKQSESVLNSIVSNHSLATSTQKHLWSPLVPKIWFWGAAPKQSEIVSNSIVSDHFLATSTQKHLSSILAPAMWFWEDAPK